MLGGLDIYPPYGTGTIPIYQETMAMEYAFMEGRGERDGLARNLKFLEEMCCQNHLDFLDYI